ncbi:HAD family phosphatase [Clostridium tagluense]|uniref:HAD family hydrolase n=1 Tax=Clostridium tagluense TaxID=360422 RepID=UPI001CF3D381|nr:HAD family phosphatase [Clostridium tagluense]MCB2312499.1 HAD family phosphatase [Clostridium tagluense]MCB2317234.1 HAD family phosphatase [Clostridium tagluense]MCB2322098.1 HAD family phosphatase [Clostridium tagluense]MCB2327183.1 HAD family phosphatase [Clostridium tagluense]MCB2331841.1 HAD family phosphatase [Clostridium tagluense]
MIKNVIFDIGNVLLEFKPLDYLKRTFNDDNIEKLLYKEIFQSEEWLDLDRGTLTQEEAIKIISLRNPNYEMHIKKCMHNWIDILIPIEGTVKILNELKEKGYKLYLLSNFHLLAFETICSKYDFFKHFDGGIISYKENLLKPEAEIYTKLLNTYKLNALECLFIDDTLVNIEAAHRLGIKTLHFESATQMAHSIIKL